MIHNLFPPQCLGNFLKAWQLWRGMAPSSLRAAVCLASQVWLCLVSLQLFLFHGFISKQCLLCSLDGFRACPSSASFQNSPYLTSCTVWCWENAQTAYYCAQCSLWQLFLSALAWKQHSPKGGRKTLWRADLGCNCHSSCFWVNKAFDDDWAVEGCF